MQKKKAMSRHCLAEEEPVPELSSSNFMQRSFGERVAMNSPIQGTAADIIKIAMIRVNERLKAEHFRSRLILQVHDELLVEAAKEELDMVKQILAEEMHGAANLKVCLEIDMHTGEELVRGKIDRRLQKVQKAGYKYMKSTWDYRTGRGREKYDPCYLEEKYRAKVIQADQVGHLVMEPDTSCYKQICSLFGEQILAADQKIDRKKLGAIVFADQEKLAMLNAIVHPAVKEYIRTAVYLEKQKACVPFVVVEAALLLEEHYDEICDEIWYIYVDDAARRVRLKQSRGYSDRKIDDILKNQQKDSVFRKSCQFVVDNSSDFVENTFEQMDRGLKEHGFL